MPKNPSKLTPVQKAADKVCRTLLRYTTNPDMTYASILEVLDEWKDAVQEEKERNVKAVDGPVRQVRKKKGTKRSNKRKNSA